nr:MAG TPA: hypothetical protein [Caudoviricetes sp.]
MYRSISRQTDPFSGRQLPGLPFYIVLFQTAPVVNSP